ncbi:TetR/AcrR family transcriptional regulator [Desulfatibacillum aliphaticivorans]|uniref:Transcriptional regulator, TetR family n=1 Tax=Desulfatibacillum aliphaticivorans TaxID=218208 RepID=B8FM28_DESAL|nr:TetR/AcrR family transcriptional regulator [Desulfatibacillum aliphaticivorans]ACL05761.1 transcriptional regulator, TetR family [Desulfatibacillum aliphaticivorans]
MSGGKIGRPRGRSGNTKQKIFETAIPMFMKKGYDNVSIDDICGKMGLTKGAFYAHYKSKDQLVVERILAADSHYREEIFPRLAAMNSVSDKLKLFCHLVFEHMEILGKNVIRTAYLIQIGHNAKLSGQMTEKRELYRIVEELIQEGQARREFRENSSSTDLTQVVMHNIRGLIYNWCLPSSQFSLLEAGEEMTEVLCSGLKAS